MFLSYNYDIPSLDRVLSKQGTNSAFQLANPTLNISPNSNSHPTRSYEYTRKGARIKVGAKWHGVPISDYCIWLWNNRSKAFVFERNRCNFGMRVKHSKTSDTTISLLFTVPSSSIAHQLRPVSGWCKSRKEHNLQGSAAQAARASGVYISLEIWNKTQLRRNPCHVIHWVSEGDSCQGQAKTSYKVSWVAWMCDKDWQSNIVWPRYWCDMVWPSRPSSSLSHPFTKTSGRNSRHSNHGESCSWSAPLLPRSIMQG